ncbi:hypothetical protein MNBD_BACTEROID03-541, partial [hydrothermal vent metagenome]
MIYIQHDGTGTGEFEKNSIEWKNLKGLVVEPTDIEIINGFFPSFWMI